MHSQQPPGPRGPYTRQPPDGYWQPPSGPYQQPPGAPYQPPSPQKKRRRGLKITLGIAGGLIVLIILIAALGSGSSDSTGGSSSGTAAVAACSSHHRITAREWLQIAKDPDAHAGECLIVYGEVTQFDSATGNATFRADTGAVRQHPQFGVVTYPTNTMLTGRSAQLASLVEGDLFTARVTVLGHVDYDTQIGGNTTAPSLRVDSVKTTGHLDTP
jgi:hypothetical protein